MAVWVAAGGRGWSVAACPARSRRTSAPRRSGSCGRLRPGRDTLVAVVVLLAVMPDVTLTRSRTRRFSATRPTSSSRGFFSKQMPSGVTQQPGRRPAAGFRGRPSKADLISGDEPGAWSGDRLHRARPGAALSSWRLYLVTAPPAPVDGPAGFSPRGRALAPSTSSEGPMSRRS